MIVAYISSCGLLSWLYRERFCADTCTLWLRLEEKIRLAWLQAIVFLHELINFFERILFIALGKSSLESRLLNLRPSFCFSTHTTRFFIFNSRMEVTWRRIRVTASWTITKCTAQECVPFSWFDCRRQKLLWWIKWSSNCWHELWRLRIDLVVLVKCGCASSTLHSTDWRIALIGLRNVIIIESLRLLVLSMARISRRIKLWNRSFRVKKFLLSTG